MSRLILQDFFPTFPHIFSAKKFWGGCIRRGGRATIVTAARKRLRAWQRYCPAGPEVISEEYGGPGSGCSPTDRAGPGPASGLIFCKAQRDAGPNSRGALARQCWRLRVVGLVVAVYGGSIQRDAGPNTRGAELTKSTHRHSQCWRQRVVELVVAAFQVCLLLNTWGALTAARISSLSQQKSRGGIPPLPIVHIWKTICFKTSGLAR